MKNGNLYQEIKSAKKDKKIASARYHEMGLKMERELEEVTRLIKEKYEPSLENLKKESFEKGVKLWYVSGIYHNYCEFFTQYITNIVAILMTYIEGEKYITYNNFDNHEINESSIVIKETINNKYNKINYDILNKLYKKGDLIILERGFSNLVSFYNNIGEPMYNFGNFNYLCEFVNRLIQYRIDNDKKSLDDITFDDLYEFMCSFIKNHPDLANKNRVKREKMLSIIQNDEDLLVVECKKLQKKIDR